MCVMTLDKGFSKPRGTHPPPTASTPHSTRSLYSFAQFFISPLISKDGVSREAKAVDSECVCWVAGF